ncbi:MAG: DUF4368 domain-containing protein [Firmicutes bacterium]|nr:DUF4368 domain-containing protein [Bacillota bacterium]
MNEKLLKVAIYLRLSNEDKDKTNKEESESIKNQRNMLLDYINNQPNFILFDEYCDEDLSGAGTYRPEFERLINDCENRKIDIILCKSQSRFSRDMEIVEKYINNKFKEWNIRFIGLSDNADTNNFGNKKSRQINGLVNEWFLEDTSNSIRSAFYSKMKQGEFISPFAPFGYKICPNDNNKLIVDPIAAEIVKEIFNLYLMGLGFTSIAKYLNNKKVPSPSFYKYKNGIKLNINSNRPIEEIKWSTNTIKTILKNKVYLGHLIQGKRTTISYKNHKIVNKKESEWIKKENTHEAIIDEETFNKVQSNILKKSKPMKTTGIIHNFSGKIFCKECGKYMKKKNSSKHEYLVCSNNLYDCKNKSSIRYDILKDLILSNINNKLVEFYDFYILKDFYYKNEKNDFTKLLDTLKKEKNSINNEILKNKNYIKKLYEDKVDGHISIEQFKELTKFYAEQTSNLKTKIECINNKIDFYNNSIKNTILSFHKYKQFSTLNKFIIDEFIDKIYICKIDKDSNTRNIEINWNF